MQPLYSTEPGECIPAYYWTRMPETVLWENWIARLTDAAANGRPLETALLQRIERCSESVQQYANMLLWGRKDA